MIYTTLDGTDIEIHSSLEIETMLEGQIAIEDLSDNSAKAIYLDAKDALIFAKYLEIEAFRILNRNRS